LGAKGDAANIFGRFYQLPSHKIQGGKAEKFGFASRLSVETNLLRQQSNAEEDHTFLYSFLHHRIR